MCSHTRKLACFAVIGLLVGPFDQLLLEGPFEVSLCQKTKTFTHVQSIWWSVFGWRLGYCTRLSSPRWGPVCIMKYACAQDAQNCTCIYIRYSNTWTFHSILSTDTQTYKCTQTQNLECTHLHTNSCVHIVIHVGTCAHHACTHACTHKHYTCTCIFHLLSHTFCLCVLGWQLSFWPHIFGLIKFDCIIFSIFPWFSIIYDIFVVFPP